MTDSDDVRLTFSQRHGYEDVPQPLQLGELSWAARVAIWNRLYAHLLESRSSHVGHYIIGLPWINILGDLHIGHNMPLDEWSPRFERWRSELRRRIERSEVNHVFDLIEFLMRHRECPQEFIVQMADVFRNNRLAYTIDAGPPPTIVPATTPEEGDQLTGNLKVLRAAGLHAAATHLHTASKCINDGDWSGSVRESIHAVESVAKQIDPGGANTLGKALDSLQKRGVLQHKALKKSLSELYGYTSDAQGIRHALLDGDKADVTIDEAVFMLGACASFASYLWRKHQAANAQ